MSVDRCRGPLLLSVAIGCMTAAACTVVTAERPPALPSPAATNSHPLAGFWKDGHCDDPFGLSIAPAGPSLYSVSFCGPGGCFEPGTYRPNTPILGDPDYQVIDGHTLGLSTRDGMYQRYSRCPDGRG